jgi:hypothetical protein
MASQTGLEQRLLPLTRRALAVASALVLAAGGQLFVLTDHTDRFFAWTIQAGLSAAVLGAFYWASLALLAFALVNGTWGTARSALPGVALFTTLTLVATLLHLGLFHLDSDHLITRLVTWAWVVVYVVAPPAFVAAYVLELRRGEAVPASTTPMPPWFRTSFGVLGAGLVGLGVALFVAPGGIASIWPWPLTPLTARAIGAWLVGIGGVMVGAVLDGDLRRAVPAAAAAIALAALVLVAVARYADQVEWGGGRGAILLGVAVVLGVGGAFVLRGARISAR